MVQKNFAGPGVYPVYVLQHNSQLAIRRMNLTVDRSTGPIPGVDEGYLTT